MYIIKTEKGGTLMKFGDNLRKLRKSKKLSQEDLAEKMNVSRQSVSKWETGEAYPEMNNILELCKIFHCRINDLVNDSIIDIEELDEEIRKNVVKLKKEQQNKMKALSKTIALIAKICRILVTICIPIVIASMIILNIVIYKVDIKENKIIWNHHHTISIIETKEKISLKRNDEIIVDDIPLKEILKIKEVFRNNSKPMILAYVETGFIFLIISLVLLRIMLKALEKLFQNINKGDTPFTLENVLYIKKMAYSMIGITIFPNLMGILFELILKMDLEIGFEIFSLVEILFLFSIAYIFQYGYEIQLDSKGKMYGDECE